MASVVASMLTMTRPAGSPIAPYKNFCRPGLLTAISCKFAPTVKAKNDPKPTYIPACHWVHSCLDIMKQCSVKVDDTCLKVCTSWATNLLVVSGKW